MQLVSKDFKTLGQKTKDMKTKDMKTIRCRKLSADLKTKD